MYLTEHLADAICSLLNRKYPAKQNLEDAQYMLDKWFGKGRYTLSVDETTLKPTITDNKTKLPATYYK